MGKMHKNELMILIIEDDLIIAENLKENLYEMGYGKVFHATNSVEGLDIYQKYQPDLCLVDIQLNESPMDGIEMVQSQQLGEKTPIIYLTSFSDASIRERAKKTNPAGYLIKPSSKTQIDVAIDMALSSFYKSPHTNVLPKCPLHTANGVIFLKVRNKEYDRYEKFYIKDIVYIKAEGSYSQVFVEDKAPLLSMNLNKALEILKSNEIIRSHRSYAVNLDHVHSVDQSFFYILHSNEVINIPIGDLYRGEVNARINKI